MATVQITTGKSKTRPLIGITELQAKTVSTQQVPGGLSTLYYKINIGNLAQGIYKLTVYFNGIENQSIRVLKN